MLNSGFIFTCNCSITYRLSSNRRVSASPELYSSWASGAVSLSVLKLGGLCDGKVLGWAEGFQQFLGCGLNAEPSLPFFLWTIFPQPQLWPYIIEVGVRLHLKPEWKVRSCVRWIFLSVPLEIRTIYDHFATARNPCCEMLSFVCKVFLFCFVF